MVALAGPDAPGGAVLTRDQRLAALVDAAEERVRAESTQEPGEQAGPAGRVDETGR